MTARRAGAGVATAAGVGADGVELHAQPSHANATAGTKVFRIRRRSGRNYNSEFNLGVA
jgi:hypothetical protein